MSRHKAKKKRSRRSQNRPSAGPQARARKGMKALLVGGIAALAIGGITVYVLVGDRSGTGPAVDVRMPELSALAQRGARAFEGNCSACHGTNAGGTTNGPPLVHRIYEPSHHGDFAFRRAAHAGVRPHHWRFGAMPKVGVSDRELDSIIAYVRELQRANGIR
jgi:mono/diheme cytochrome c family protein